MVLYLPLAAYGQSASFELLARNDDYGSATALAELPDGNICLGSSRGLAVYVPTDSGLTMLFERRGNIGVRDIAVRADGSVFAACGTEGLYACYWDGQMLGPPVRAAFVQFAECVAVGNDGVLYCAGGRSGYFAIEWNGKELVPIDSFAVDGLARSFAIAANGDIIVSGNNSEDDSIRVIRLRDQSLVQVSVMGDAPARKLYPTMNGKAFFIDAGDEVSVIHYDSSGFSPARIIHTTNTQSVAGTDSTVYVGDSRSLLVFRLNGDAYEQIARIETDVVTPVDILLASDEQIYTAEFDDGMGVFELEERVLIETGRVNNGGYAFDCVQGPDGLIWVANGGGGVRAYRRTDSLLTFVAHIDEGGDARDIAVAPDGTVFVANGGDGVRAYSLRNGRLLNVGHLPDSSDWCQMIEVGPDSTIFCYLDESGIWALRHDGSSFTRVANAPATAFAEDLAVTSSGAIFLGNGWDGLEAYTFTGDSLVMRARIKEGTVFGVAATTDSTVYSALSSDGLKVYRYDGTSFAPLASTADILARKVRADENGVVFVNTFDELQSYQFDGNGFTWLARYPQSFWSIFLGDSGSVFALTNQGEVVMLQYHDGVDGINRPDEVDALRLYNSPNPFRIVTTIQFQLPRTATMDLTVYDVYGRRIQHLISRERRAAGMHRVIFDSRDLPSGIYFYHLSYEGSDAFRRMVLLR